MWQLVDDYLHQARDLLGTGTPALPTPPTPPGTDPLTPDTWNGPAATTATATTQTLDATRGQLTAGQSQTDHQLTAAADISRTAHRALNAIQTSWESDKAALEPFANTPEGQSALTRAGQQRITETQALVNDTATKYGTAAANVRTAQLGLPTADDPNTPSDTDDKPTRPHRGRPDRPEAPDPRRPPEAGDPPAHQTPRGAPSFPNAPTGVAANRTLPPMTGAGMPMSPSVPAAGMPMGGAAPMSALSALLQPLEQAVEQAATPGAATADSSQHRDDNPPAGEGEKVVNAARRALGLPYIWGGGNTAGPTGGGFDCSGLVQYSVAQATNGQVILPRTTYEQINCGRLTALADARPGDLVFSNFSAPGVPEHVQIYAGEGRVIEAQQSGVPVKVSPVPAGQVIIKRVI